MHPFSSTKRGFLRSADDVPSLGFAARRRSALGAGSQELLGHSINGSGRVLLTEVAVALYHRQRLVAEYRGDVHEACAAHGEVTGGTVPQVVEA